jgi:hypothetical protein
VTPFVGAVAIASILASIGIEIGLILIIVPGLILLTSWSLIVPEIVVGGAGALDSASSRLTPSPLSVKELGGFLTAGHALDVGGTAASAQGVP